ncbi:MAG: hypothetical protein AAF533_12015 [Acidobacteriota bacterium]
METTEGRRLRALRRKGRSIEPAEPSQQAEDLLASAADILILDVRPGSDGEELLDQVERYLEEGRRGALVLLIDWSSESQLRRAVTLTPHCLPRDTSPEALAGLVDSLDATLRSVDPLLAVPDDLRKPRKVKIILGERVQVDGLTVSLNIAAQRFLHELAASRDAVVTKRQRIETSNGRTVPASEARKQLTGPLGEELTNLLIESGRHQPYRLRDRAEVAAICRDEPTRHRPTKLTVIGRSSVYGQGGFDMDRFEALEGLPDDDLGDGNY